jgi:hypothetical protein
MEYGCGTAIARLLAAVAIVGILVCLRRLG